jgi:hypothetical protein
MMLRWSLGAYCDLSIAILTIFSSRSSQQSELNGNNFGIEVSVRYYAARVECAIGALIDSDSYQLSTARS